MSHIRSAIILTLGLIMPSICQSALAGDYVSVNGIDTYYEVSGQGDPLVVLHGAHMNINTMGDIIPALAEKHTVYAFEFQGHGRSTDIDREITYVNLADDTAAFMDAIGLQKADIFGYSMGAGAALQLAIRHPEKVDQIIAASTSYSIDGFQPAFKAMIPQMTPDMFAFFKEPWQALAPDPQGYDAFIDKMIALEHDQFDWEAEVKALTAPVLIIVGDADVLTLEHAVSMFRLLGGGIAGDMGQPLPESRLAVMPATAHTAVINQTEMLLSFIEPFLAHETPKGFFDQ